MFFSRHQTLVSLGVFLLSLLLPARSLADDIPVVAVSIPPLKHFVQGLLGEDAKVLVVIPAGADHESYEPGISQLQALSKADAFLPIAHPKSSFENPWMERLQELRGSSVPLKVLRPSSRMMLPADDMHYWTSPTLISEFLEKLAEDLKETFPRRRDRIEKALIVQRSAVEKTLEGLRLTAKNSPGCVFLVYHAAWSGLAKDLGFEELAIEHEGREPSLRSVAAIVGQAKAKHLHTLFIEPQRSPSSVRAYLEELSATAEVLDPLAEDWEANLQAVTGRILKSCSAKN